MRDAETIHQYLVRLGFKPLDFIEPTPTSQAAAAAVGCSEAEIAKSVLMMVGSQPVLVVTSGDTRVKSGLLKKSTGLSGRVQLPSPEQVVAMTGYPPGAVSPFLLPDTLPVLLDVSLQRFDKVYPAAGTDRSAVAIDTEQLPVLCRGKWVNVAAIVMEEDQLG